MDIPRVERVFFRNLRRATMSRETIFRDDEDDRWIWEQVQQYEQQSYEERLRLNTILLDLNVKFPYNMCEVDENEIVGKQVNVSPRGEIKSYIREE
jgi:uncharacterized FlgJ-related protein